MKKLILALMSLATLHAQHDSKWPHALCGTCVDTCNPYAMVHYETARRRYTKIPRAPYQKYTCITP